MSDALGRSASTMSFGTTTSSSLRDPVLQGIEDQGRAIRLCESPATPAVLGKAIDSVTGLEGAGIVGRVEMAGSAPIVRTLRLARAPGDVRVCLMFGAPSPAPGTVGTNHHLRNELLAGGLSCGAAIFGWIGFVGGAALAVPTGGLSVAGMVYDGLAASAASIACINSGVRILNEARGNHATNERLDSKPVYANTMLGLDVFGAAGIYRGGADGVRAVSAMSAAAKSGASVTGIVRVIALDREIKIRLVNALGAAVTAISSNDAGALGAVEKGLGIPFTIVLSN